MVFFFFFIENGSYVYYTDPAVFNDLFFRYLTYFIDHDDKTYVRTFVRQVL